MVYFREGPFFLVVKGETINFDGSRGSGTESPGFSKANLRACSAAAGKVYRLSSSDARRLSIRPRTTAARQPMVRLAIQTAPRSPQVIWRMVSGEIVVMLCLLRVYWPNSQAAVTVSPVASGM